MEIIRAFAPFLIPIGLGLTIGNFIDLYRHHRRLRLIPANEISESLTNGIGL